MDEFGSNKQLWMGAVQAHWDEHFLSTLFLATGTCTGARIHRPLNRTAGFAFIDFSSHEAAKYVLDTYNGQQIPGEAVVFRLNWGKAKSTSGDHAGAVSGGAEFNMFVGDIANEVSDPMLSAAFRERYKSILDAKVIIDPNSGKSKNYGFVKFALKSEYDQALIEMNGARIGSRAIRVNKAMQKNKPAPTVDALSHPAMIYGAAAAYGSYPAAYPAAAQYYGMYGAGHHHAAYPATHHHAAATAETGSSKYTVFVGNLCSSVTEEMLSSHFSGIGGMMSATVPPGKGCGFVNFAARENAELAISNLHGSQLGSSRIRCDWGKGTAAASSSADPSAAALYYQQQQQQMYLAYYSQYTGYGQQAMNGYLHAAAMHPPPPPAAAVSPSPVSTKKKSGSDEKSAPLPKFDDFLADSAGSVKDVNVAYVRHRTSSAPTLSLAGLRGSFSAGAAVKG